MKSALFVTAITAAASAASAQVVFSNNFEGAMPAEVSGAGSIVGSQGFGAYGFGNNLLQNDATGNPATATTLTINGLPTHTALNIGFLLAVIDSWDSTNGSPAPDFFNVDVDGVNVFQATFAQASGGVEYAFPAGGQLFNNINVGFGGYNEDGYDMSLEPALQNIAHTGSSVVITFYASGAGWQGSSDESFGIDNLVVTAVPTPGAAAVLSLGGLALSRRRRA